MSLHVDAALEALVEEELENDAGQVAELCASMLLAGGKRLRPLLILLAHEIAGGQDADEVMPLALAFELIHTATLVHDDINDEASMRRGVETIHSQSRSCAKAVIAGDWLFVQGFGLGGRYEENIVRLMAKCCADIAVAEFHQLDHVLNLATSPEDYLVDRTRENRRTLRSRMPCCWPRSRSHRTTSLRSWSFWHGTWCCIPTCG